MDSDSAAKISQILQLTVMKICQSVVNYTDQLAVQVRASNKAHLHWTKVKKLLRNWFLYKLSAYHSVLVGICFLLNFAKLTVKYCLHVTSPFITYRYCLQGSHQKSEKIFRSGKSGESCVYHCVSGDGWVLDRMGLSPVLCVILTVTIGTILKQ